MKLSFSLYLMIASVMLFCMLSCNQESNIKNEPSELTLKKAPYLEFLQARLFPETELDMDAYLAAAKQANISQVNFRSDGDWVNQGPGNFNGRITDIKLDSEGIIYVSYARSGLFKSVDGGQSFEPMTLDQPLLSSGPIAIHPTDDDVIYLGTGDPAIPGYYGIGRGVIRSNDGGSTWESVGLDNAGIISRIHISPTNPDIIYVAALGAPFEQSNDRGVYKSTDGGQTWDQVLFISLDSGVQDLMVDPTNPDIVYAAGWTRLRSNNFSVIDGPEVQIHRSRDGGATWEILTNDLPEEEFSKIGFAMSGSDPNIIFVDFCTTPSFHSLHKSTDGGDTWTQIAANGDDGIGTNSHGGFAWYFGDIAVNPEDDDDIFIMGVTLTRTRDGGDTWNPVATNVHVDHHVVTFDGDQVYLGNDGGMYRADVGGDDWIDIDDTPTAMIYRVGYNPWEPDNYYGGSQDNGTYEGNADDINNWFKIGFGDGFYSAFNPDDPNVFYTESQNGNINYNIGFSRFSITDDMTGPFFWDTPYLISPHNSDLVITGSNMVWGAETSGGPGNFVTIPLSPVLTDESYESVSHTISTVDQSPVSQTTLYAGTTDGLAWRSVDFGVNWERIDDGLERRYISRILPSPVDPNQVFISQTGYRNGDYIAHIYRSDDQGTTWTDISGNLPAFAVNDIVVYPPSDELIIFAATDGGVYFTEDEGVTWDRLGDNLPLVPVFDLEYNVANNEMVAATFGLGVQSFDLSQVDIVPGDISSVEDNILTGVRVSPTIVSSHINVQTLESVDYMIYNMQGYVLDKGAVTDSKGIDCNHLTSGSYIIKLRSGSNEKSVKFLKI